VEVAHPALVAVVLALVGGCAGAPGPDGTGSPPRSVEPGDASPKAGMVVIPSGDFVMGNDDSMDERPAHRVHVDAFALDVTEVTVADYAVCSRAGACPPAATEISWTNITDADRARSPFCNAGQAAKAQHPINCVSWDEASAYCSWVKKRLPSEEEWEYAARGHEGHTYPWGEAAPTDQLCWKRQNGTCPVAQFPDGHGPFGGFDLAGNVGEWTASAWSSTYDSPRDSPARVTRGGSWSYILPSSVGGAHRDASLPNVRLAEIGFRCARSGVAGM
jgi:formylglycine-generating enzyme required for sulfatase activity